MSYPLTEEKNDGVIILDKKGNIFFSNADSTVNSNELKYVLFFSKNSSHTEQGFSSYKDIISSIFSSRLLEGKKYEIITLDFFKNYLIVIIRIDDPEEFVDRNACTINSEIINIFKKSIIEGISAVINQKDINFIDVLQKAEKNMYTEYKRLKFISFEEEADILIRIEMVRQELYKMIGSNNNFLDHEIVEMSQYLDKLLVKYIRDSGGEYNGKKQYKL